VIVKGLICLHIVQNSIAGNDPGELNQESILADILASKLILTKRTFHTKPMIILSIIN